MIVVKPLLYGQESGNVRLELPSNWSGPWSGPSGVVVEVDTNNTSTLLGVVLTAIREAGDHEEIEAARMLCRAVLGAGAQ
jgi:hypothetical protein